MKKFKNLSNFFRKFKIYSDIIFMKIRSNLPKTSLPRIFYIDRKIAEGNYPNVPKMAKEYETSLSSINRDIAYMRDMLDAPIAYDFYKKGFYYTEKNFRLLAAYDTAEAKIRSLEGEG